MTLPVKQPSTKVFSAKTDFSKSVNVPLKVLISVEIFLIFLELVIKIMFFKLLFLKTLFKFLFQHSKFIPWPNFSQDHCDGVLEETAAVF